jgi:hypothetical protein
MVSYVWTNLRGVTKRNSRLIRALLRENNRYVGKLLPLPDVFRDYPASVFLNGADGREMVPRSS